MPSANTRALMRSPGLKLWLIATCILYTNKHVVCEHAFKELIQSWDCACCQHCGAQYVGTVNVQVSALNTIFAW